MVGYWRSLACQAWAHASGRRRAAWPARSTSTWPSASRCVPGDAGERGLAGAPGRAPGRRPWTSFELRSPSRDELELPWTERGVVVCGDGDYDAPALTELAGRAGWPVLAEPSSGARRGPNALSAYQYLLATPEFMAAHALT